jgi:hypothetical protein
MAALSVDETAACSVEQKDFPTAATWDLPEADRWAVQMAADSVFRTVVTMAVSSAATTVMCWAVLTVRS